MTVQPDSVLRHRPFVLFWLARLSVTFGYQMLVVAVGWQLYALTGDPFDLGLVGLIQFIPAMLLFLVVGQMTDRYDRRVILIACQMIEAIAAATLFASVLTGAISRDVILGTAFILGVARAFELTVMQIVVPSLVPLPLVPRAVAGSATANQTATIAGPALGGFLYAAGPAAVYGSCLALFATAVLLTLMIHIERAAQAREPLTLSAFFAGFAFIRRNPVIFGVISLDLFAVLLGGVTALLPVFARDVFAAGPWGLGLLRAAPAVGALGMALALTRWPIERNAGKVIFAVVAAFGLSTIVFALSSTLVVALAALVVLGASDMVSVVLRMTLVQLGTPDDVRGRVTAVNGLFIGTSNQLGEFRAGAMASWIGAVPAVLIGGIGTLVIVVLWAGLFPALWRADRLEGKP
ncbi:MAG: MFS transporter [Alphaproteobacteria bacterium]|nr:MAG: MFS transporter [Alphaproteobacteria bacterium]